RLALSWRLVAEEDPAAPAGQSQEGEAALNAAFGVGVWGPELHSGPLSARHGRTPAGTWKLLEPAERGVKAICRGRIEQVNGRRESGFLPGKRNRPGDCGTALETRRAGRPVQRCTADRGC